MSKSIWEKMFGKNSHLELVEPTAPEVSKGYHSCVDTCEKDISNLEAEIESLRKDNSTLMGQVATLQVKCKGLEEDVSEMAEQAQENLSKIVERDDRIKELEERLSEADKKADGTPVKYASARKALTKAKLKQLRSQLEAVPSGANGFGGSCMVYDKKTKRVSNVEFKSKEEALELVGKAEKGNVDIIM